MATKDKCPDLAVWSAYWAGTLDPAKRAALQIHRQRCAACAALVSELESSDLESETGQAPPRLDEAPPASGDSAEEPASQADRDRSAISALALEKSENPTAIGRLGKYDILQVLGHGGMGVVLRGYDMELRREVAIKTLNHALSASAVAKRRFMREARAAAAVNHPHVVTIYSVDQHQGIPYIVMELVRGPTLAEEIRTRGRIDPIRTIRIAAQIASGLAAAHAQGVIHRDIKPGNVMLEYDVDRCKITDFGLARATIDNVELTSREMGVGTPAYMAPEQVTEGEVDGRSDLFAEGCVMYAMLVGHSPFHGRNALEIIRLVERCAPPDLRSLDSGIPEFLASIVMRLLRKDPAERFQSAAELADVLNRHLTMINQTKSDEQGRIPLTTPLQSISVSRRRTRRLAAATLIALTCLIAGTVGWWSWGNRAPGNQDSVNTLSLKRMTVSRSGGADFTTLSAAIEAARPGTVIVVTDDGVYSETVTLATNDLTVRAERQATISPPLHAPDSPSHSVVIHDCHNVTLEGFRIEAGPTGHAVFVHGSVGNLMLSKLHIVPAASANTQPPVHLAGHSAAASSGPVTLESCSIQSYKFPCVWLAGHTAPTVLRNCELQPAETAIGIWSDCGDLEVSHCIIRGGISGINSVVQNWSAAQHLHIVNNTSDRTTNFLGFQAAVPPHVEVLIANNLILDGIGYVIPAEALEDLVRRNTFACNFWQVPEGVQWTPEILGRVAVEWRDSGAHIPRDPAQPDYLTPSSDSALGTAGVGGNLPAYVGARKCGAGGSSGR
jgi:serine/threonine protein kinase